MEEYELNRSNCEIHAPLSGLENLLKSFNETYRKDFGESICHLQKNKQIETESYFTDFANSTEYLSLKDIDTNKITAMESRLSSTNLNCTEDSINVKRDVPLRVLIRRMLDEAFGKPTDTADVDKNLFNVENNNCKVNLSNSLAKDESTNSNSEMNDHTSFHESRDDYTRQKDDKLVTIAEERSNSLHHADIMECTGLYLSGLFKFDGKLIDPVKDKNPLLLRNDTEVFPSQIDTDIQIVESLCRTIVVQDESSIYEQNNDDKDESVMIINTIDSSNDIDLSSNYERTVDFFNFSEDKSDIKMKQAPNESLSSFDEDKTRSSTDACLKDIECSMKKKPKFISTFTLNLRRSCKRHRQSITLFRQALLKRTPKLSLKTDSKSAKTPGRNVTRSRNNSKQKKLLPQIILTPATPKPIPLL